MRDHPIVHGLVLEALAGRTVVWARPNSAS